MNALAKSVAAESAAPSPLEIFRIRAWARAQLWAAGALELHESVDELQAAAERDNIDTDLVQTILAEQFGAIE